MSTETPTNRADDLDLDVSPFQRQAIEGLPLTKDERAVLRSVIDDARREREEMARKTSVTEGSHEH